MSLEISGVSLQAQGAAAFGADMKGAEKAVTGFVDTTEKGGGKVSSAGQVMIGALRELGTIAVKAFATAAKAGAEFLGDSISVAGDFEAGMKKFQAVAGAGVDTKGLEEFKDLFISLGKELPVSTSEVEQAAIEMVSGGIDPAIVAAGALRQTIQFAAASGLSLADAAATSAKFLAGWTSSAATAAEKVDFLALSTDVLTKAAAASSTTAAELRLGLFNTQGAAQALHASFTDVTATLALLAPAFESSAQAGTALNVFMTRLVPSTAPAAAAMQELGLMTTSTTKIMDFLRSKGIQPLGTDLDTLGNQFTEYAATQDFTAKATTKLWESFDQSLFFDAQGNFAGMSNAAQLLKEKMGGLTDEQKINTLHTIFGNDAMKVANLLMQDGAAGLEGMLAKMKEANGVSATAALMQSGYNTALENAKGSVEALKITLGSRLLPVLTDLFNNVIAPGINTVTDFTDALFGNDEAFARLSPTMQDIATMIGVVVADTQNIIGAFDDAGAMSSDFGSAIGYLVDDLGGPGDLIAAIVFATQDLVSWFGTAGDSSSALDAVLVDLNDTWDNVLYTVEDVGNGYLAIANAILPIVQKLWADHGAEITTFITKSYNSIMEIITLALSVYDAIVPPILNAVAGFIRDHTSEITKVLTGAWEMISSLISGTLETIKGVFKLALAVIHGDWSAAWVAIQGIADAQVKAISGIVTGFLDLIAGLFNTSLADIGRVWANNWNSMVNLVSKIGWWEAGKSVVQGLKKGIDDAWNSLLSWFNDKVSGLVDAAMSAIGAGSPATEFMPVGQFAVQGIMMGFTNEWPALTALVTGLGDDLVSQMSDIAQAAQSTIADAFTATASIDRQMADNLEKLGKVQEGAFGRDAVASQLAGELEVAKAFQDPAVAAKYFKMRSDQIFEYEKLRDDLSKATDAKERERIEQRQRLLLKAFEAERQAFETTQQRTDSPVADLTAQINQMIAQTNQAIAGFTGKVLDDAGIATVDALYTLLDRLNSLPHLAGGGAAKSGQPYWVGEQGPELFWPQMNGTVMPAASSAQMASSANTTNYHGQVGNSYTMPIYTNNSPAALQQSLAIAQASMP